MDFESHGYGIVDVTAERTTYDIFFTPILEPSDVESHHQSWFVEHSGPEVAGHRVVRADAPTTTRDGTPPAPPASTSTPPGPPAPGTDVRPAAPAAVPTLPATGGSGQLLAGVALAGLGAVVAHRSASCSRMEPLHPVGDRRGGHAGGVEALPRVGRQRTEAAEQ